jgi:hypothetical protein
MGEELPPFPLSLVLLEALKITHRNENVCANFRR